jgi:hypothetical protein
MRTLDFMQQTLPQAVEPPLWHCLGDQVPDLPHDLREEDGGDFVFLVAFLPACPPAFLDPFFKTFGVDVLVETGLFEIADKCPES